MLDIVQNDYLDLGMPNVKAERKKAADPVKVGIHEFMKPFVFEAAKLFPMWEFIGKRGTWKHIGNQDEAVAFWCFAIYENRELLGTIDYDNTRNGYVYCLSNERIENKRERGRAARTKDLKKALKILGKEFGAKKIGERLEEAHQKCNNALSNLFYEKSKRFSSAYSYVANMIESHIMSNWDTYREVLLSNNADPKIVDNIMSLNEERNVSINLSKAFNTNAGVVVVTHGNDYAVRDDDETRIYGTDNLPDWIKRGVGMLKLIDKGNLISNIGYKEDDQIFFVLKGTE